MALNDAFEALEQMRKANLEIEFGRTIDFNRCVHCLRNPPSKKGLLPKSIFPRSKRNHKPCLLCGSPTCSKHASKEFLKSSKIIICTSCAPLFSLDFVIECVGEEGASEKTTWNH